ncbi:hypothetical protein DL89DRAFT_7551 [Linderina pennispora]|uniref:Uncharacterized protein n=1 Tax=Linderina pennispora TaxID=61395 RepID=A0A1Y1WLA7_9FUNG|nr:uncharacterized protein DL89DRAFT_7551 [Linderina pennispora]ORX73976.1 hypothetical protein DL89DRAFT_7551 [Linderina pennispora]
MPPSCSIFLGRRRPCNDQDSMNPRTMRCRSRLLSSLSQPLCPSLAAPKRSRVPRGWVTASQGSAKVRGRRQLSRMAGILLAKRQAIADQWEAELHKMSRCMAAGGDCPTTRIAGAISISSISSTSGHRQETWRSRGGCTLQSLGRRCHEPGSRRAAALVQ